MIQKPKRTRSHVLGAEAVRFIMNILPSEWPVTEFKEDYGIDLMADIVERGEVTGFYFSIQSKGLEIENNPNYVRIRNIKRTTINFWRSRIEPVILIAYIAAEERAYWLWFNEKTIDLSSSQKKYSIKIPKENKLTSKDSEGWEVIGKRTIEVSLRKKLVDKIINFDISALENKAAYAAWRYYLEGAYEKSLGECYKLIDQDSDSVAWLMIASHCEYCLYNYRDALFFINKAIDINQSTDIELIEQLEINKACILAEYGWERKSKEYIIQAEKIFAKYVKENQSDIYHYNYANTLSNLGKYGLAEKEYKKALKLNPNSEMVWKNLGEVYFQLGKHKLEMKCYDKALRINPKLLQAQISKGITLMRNFEKYHEGLNLLESIEDIEALEKSFPKYFGWVAYGHLFLGNPINAYEAVQRGLRNNLDNQELLIIKRKTLSILIQHNNEYLEEALQFFELEFEKSEYDFEALQQLAMIKRKQGLKESKVWDFINNQIKIDLELVKTRLNEDDYSIADFIDAISDIHSYSHFRALLPIYNHIKSFPYTNDNFEESLESYLFFVFMIIYSRANCILRQVKKAKNKERLRNAITNKIEDEFIRLATTGYNFYIKNFPKDLRKENEEIDSKVMGFFFACGMIEWQCMSEFLIEEYNSTDTEPNYFPRLYKI